MASTTQVPQSFSECRVNVPIVYMYLNPYSVHTALVIIYCTLLVSLPTQDPTTIEHETAVSGDTYAVVDKPKRSSKKKGGPDVVPPPSEGVSGAVLSSKQLLFSVVYMYLECVCAC